jgi:hypothetical protein
MLGLYKIYISQDTFHYAKNAGRSTYLQDSAGGDAGETDSQCTSVGEAAHSCETVRSFGPWILLVAELMAYRE